MANILIAFHNGVVDENNAFAMPIFYESFITGLEKAGNTVYAFYGEWFRGNWEEIPARLIRAIKNFKPDLCFLFNNCFYDISDIVDCPIVIYSVDSTTYFSNKDNLRKKPDRYLYFCSQVDDIEIIHHLFRTPKKFIFYLPFFSSVQAENIELSTNISFIGTNFKESTHPRFFPNSFSSIKPNLYEKKLYHECINFLKKNPQITTEELINHLRIDSKKVATAISIPDILMYLSNEKRIHVLSAVVDMGLEIYGTENWGKDYYYDYRLNLAYNYENIYSLEHNQKIYNSSKIGISISHLQATSGFPWRVMDIMASNACLVTDYHQGFEELFKGIKLPVYSSEYEAREICQHLLKEENKRKEIVAQCQEIINKNYRFDNLLRKMEDYLGISLHMST